MQPVREFNAASRSSIAARKAVPAASRRALRAVPASRIRAPPANSLAALAPSIRLVQVLPVPVQAVQAPPAAVLALAHVPASELLVQAALALLPEAHRLPAKRRVLRVLRDHRVAVVANNTPRPRKAR